MLFQVAAHLAALQRQLEVPRELTYDEMGRLENMVGPTPGMVNSIKVTSLTSNPVCCYLLELLRSQI